MTDFNVQELLFEVKDSVIGQESFSQLTYISTHLTHPPTHTQLKKWCTSDHYHKQVLPNLPVVIVTLHRLLKSSKGLDPVKKKTTTFL